jgi:hypothetical protein
MAEEIHKQVKFDYLKSNSFRVVHADGAWGGITPTLNIFMAFFSERPPIPKQTVFEVKPDGRVGSEIQEKRDARDAIIREVEIGVQMNLAAAKALLAWLDEKIQLLEKFHSEQTEPGSAEPTGEPKQPQAKGDSE